jgi:hypothetical protein
MISSGVIGMTEKKEKGTRGQRSPALAYSFPRFCFLKFTKPAHERDIQVPANAARAINAALTRR